MRRRTYALGTTSEGSSARAGGASAPARAANWLWAGPLQPMCWTWRLSIMTCSVRPAVGSSWIPSRAGLSALRLGRVTREPSGLVCRATLPSGRCTVTFRLASFQLLTAWSASAMVAWRGAGGRGEGAEPPAVEASLISLATIIYYCPALLVVSL
jgi:hypothetical protein